MCKNETFQRIDKVNIMFHMEIFWSNKQRTCEKKNYEFIKVNIMFFRAKGGNLNISVNL